jgi:hypothetical protein
MSKLFYDHLISLEKVEIEIKKTPLSVEEREERWHSVDGMVMPKVLDKILAELPREHHDEFLEIFYKSPHDEEVIFGYLKGKTGKDFEKKLREELKDIDAEILKELRPADEVSAETKVSKK